MVPRFAVSLGFVVVALWSGTALAGAPLQVIVSRDQQSLVVYDGDTVVATSKVSTGKAGHTTPTGIFSILEKRRFHKSNIYSNAPMPFMQRLTWSGIALHASGHVPNYPASHGCVRMPNDFASELYKMTDRGLHVVISGRQVTPEKISHATLFQPVPPQPILLSDVQLRPGVNQAPTAKSVEVAMSEPNPAAIAKPPAQPPIRMLITWRGTRETVLDIQTMLNTLGYDAGMPDGHSGPQTIAAITAFQQDLAAAASRPMPEAKTASPESVPAPAPSDVTGLKTGTSGSIVVIGPAAKTQDTAELPRRPNSVPTLTIDGKISTGLLEALYAKTGRGIPPNAQLMVRQDFKPLFETPVTVRNPEIALGTHFLQFQDVNEKDGGKGEWFGLTLDNTLPKAMKKRLGITVDANPLAYNGIAQVLNRIDIPQDTRDRIDTLLAEGSSLTISDTGLGPETGQGTDFVTITQTD